MSEALETVIDKERERLRKALNLTPSTPMRPLGAVKPGNQASSAPARLGVLINNQFSRSSPNPRKA
jgi:hypothetical protein